MIAKSSKCLQPFNLIESPHIEVLFLVPCASATIPGNSIAGFCSISKVISNILSYCGYSEKGSCRAFRNADFKARPRLAKCLFAIWFQGLQQASPLLAAIFISQILRARQTTRKHWCGYAKAEMVQGMPNSSPHNTATRFQMRAPIHPNCTQQIQLLRGTMFFSNMQVRSNVAPLPLPPLAQSQQEHLQQINFPWCIAAPLAAHRLRIQHLLPFLTSSRDAFSQLSQLLQLQTFKGFLQLDTRWRVEKKPTCYFSYIAQMEDWTWLFLQEKLGTKLQRTHIPSKDVALYPPKELGWSSPTVKHCLIEHTCLYYFKSKVGCKQFQCFDSHRAAAVSSEGATVLKQHTRSAVVWILLLF